MQTRPLCTNCNRRPAAINYRRGEKVYYRKKCAACIRLASNNNQLPLWVRSGYRKKAHCEKCGFKGKVPAQLSTYHVDNDLRNVSRQNLKTVCANCIIELAHSGGGWTTNGLTPDL